MDAGRILDAYIKVHTAYKGCVIDTSWLPTDKAKMKKVLQLYWLAAESDQIRNWAESGYYFLGWFQDRVGRIPIDVTAKARKGMPPEQHANYSLEQNRWLEVVMAEMGILMREFDQFKQEQAARGAHDKDRTRENI
jgi:hypothetical protein